MRWRPGTRASDESEERAGWLAAAHPVEQGFVLMLRAWLDGPEGRATLWDALVRSAGLAGARQILRAFESLLDALAQGATRPFRRHATRCPCLGADEAALSGMVLAAAKGRRGEAEAHVRDLLREADLVMIVQRAARIGALLGEAGAGPAVADEAWSLLDATPANRTLH